MAISLRKLTKNVGPSRSKRIAQQRFNSCKGLSKWSAYDYLTYAQYRKEKGNENKKV